MVYGPAADMDMEGNEVRASPTMIAAPPPTSHHPVSCRPSSSTPSRYVKGGCSIILEAGTAGDEFLLAHVSAK